MRKFCLITIAILMFTLTSAHSPKVNASLEYQDETIDDCPEPNINRFSYFCNAIKNRPALKNPIGDLRYEYEIKMWEMSCANPYLDYTEGQKKVREMWTKYITKCNCQTDSLSLPINILKYAVWAGWPDFIILLIDDYGVDVNFKDPVDGKTIFQYLDDEYLVALKENKSRKAEELKAIKRVILEAQSEMKK